MSGSIVKALLRRLREDAERREAELCAVRGHRWQPVIGGGRWCAVCNRYEERLPTVR